MKPALSTSRRPLARDQQVDAHSRRASRRIQAASGRPGVTSVHAQDLDRSRGSWVETRRVAMSVANPLPAHRPFVGQSPRRVGELLLESGLITTRNS